MTYNVSPNVKPSILLSTFIFVVGIVGASSFYLSDLPIPPEYRDQISPELFRINTMIGPMILVLIAAVLGHFFANRTGLNAPFLRGLLSGRLHVEVLGKQILWASISAIVALGVIFSLSQIIDFSNIREELTRLSAFENEGLHIATKLLYGSLAEEVIMRWGLFSFIAYLVLRIVGRFSNFLGFLLAMVITSAIVNVIHAPTIYSLLEQPSKMLVLYVQSIGFLTSFMACDLYRQRGLEAAILFKLFLIISLIIGGNIFII